MKTNALRKVVALLLCLNAGCYRNRQSASSASELFDLRTKCNQLASEFERDFRSKYSENLGFSVEFTSHYDPRENRCYVEHTGTIGMVKIRYVTDAQERRGIVGCSQIVNERPGEITCSENNDPKSHLTPADAKHLMDVLMSEHGLWPE